MLTVAKRLAALPSVPAHRPGLKFWLSAAAMAVLLLGSTTIYVISANELMQLGDVQ